MICSEELRHAALISGHHGSAGHVSPRVSSCLRFGHSAAIVVQVFNAFTDALNRDADRYVLVVVSTVDGRGCDK